MPVADNINTCSALTKQSYVLGRFKNQNVIVTADVNDKVSLQHFINHKII